MNAGRKTPRRSASGRFLKGGGGSSTRQPKRKKKGAPKRRRRSNSGGVTPAFAKRGLRKLTKAAGL